MAKKLSVGEIVTVRKDFWLKHDSDGYQHGIRRLRAGEIGRIVEMGNGRSVVVDFDGKRATLSSQRFDRYTPPAEPQPESEPESAPELPPPSEPINYYHPPFIKMVANNLLRTGSLEAGSDTVVLEIKLADLPEQVQEQVRALIQAKLDLGPAGLPAASKPRRTRRAKAATSAKKSKPTNGRRGRPPKKQPAE